MLDAIVQETGPSPNHAVIWLHGLGADGSDFAPVVPMLQLASPVRFIFPHAPVQPVTVNGGMQMRAWYDIYEMSLERKVDHAGVAESAAAISELIEQQVAQGIAQENVFLIGFSQGGAIALHLLETYSKPLAGVVALSTYSPNLDAPAKDPIHTSTPLAIHHGVQDPVVPEVLGQRTLERMTTLGFESTYQTWPMPHSVLPEQLVEIGRWLNQHITGN